MKLLAMAVLLTACAGVTVPVVYDVAVTREVAFTDTLDIDVFAPVSDESFPPVVLFHGGSWYGGEKATLDGFARLLATKGLVVYNATYTVGGAGGGYPGSYEDIRCALAMAADLSAGAPLTVVGYSAGAHLASTVVLSGDQFQSNHCTSTSTYTVDGFAGLAGPYEAKRYGPLLVSFFGTTIGDDPEPWNLGSPYGYLDTAIRIPIVLVHGDRDQVVQLGFSEDFNTTLAADGYDVSLTILEFADHATIVDPSTDGGAVADLIFDLASQPSD
jgi:acetyl esterase/lipase